MIFAAALIKSLFSSDEIAHDYAIVDQQADGK
jgi:hypothetical protein